MNKLTNKSTLEILRNADLTAIDCKGFAHEDIMEKVDGMIAQLSKKNGTDRKPTKVQQENEHIKMTILSALTETPVTITTLQKSSADLEEMSNQKLSALVRQLVEEGAVTKSVEKRVSLFSIPVGDEDDASAED